MKNVDNGEFSQQRDALTKFKKSIEFFELLMQDYFGIIYSINAKAKHIGLLLNTEKMFHMKRGKILIVSTLIFGRTHSLFTVNFATSVKYLYIL